MAAKGSAGRKEVVNESKSSADFAKMKRAADREAVRQKDATTWKLKDLEGQ